MAKLRSQHNSSREKLAQYWNEDIIFSRNGPFAEQNVYKLPLMTNIARNNPTYIKSLLRFFEKMTENDISSSEYNDLVRKKLSVSINCTQEYFDYQLELANAYQMYENSISYEENARTRVQYFALLLDHLKTNSSSAENVFNNALLPILTLLFQTLSNGPYLNVVCITKFFICQLRIVLANWER